jgi:excisionase family DNA binding protein
LPVLLPPLISSAREPSRRLIVTKRNSSKIRTDPLLRLLNIGEVADVLGVSIKTVRRRIEAGELPVIRDGRVVRVHPNDLDRYVASRRSL